MTRSSVATTAAVASDDKYSNKLLFIIAKQLVWLQEELFVAAIHLVLATYNTCIKPMSMLYSTFAETIPFAFCTSGRTMQPSTESKPCTIEYLPVGQALHTEDSVPVADGSDDHNPALQRSHGASSPAAAQAAAADAPVGAGDRRNSPGAQGTHLVEPVLGHALEN